MGMMLTCHVWTPTNMHHSMHAGDETQSGGRVRTSGHASAAPWNILVWLCSFRGACLVCVGFAFTLGRENSVAPKIGERTLPLPVEGGRAPVVVSAIETLPGSTWPVLGTSKGVGACGWLGPIETDLL